jgi:DNA-binding beta-propeller fold protein YncE
VSVKIRDEKGTVAKKLSDVAFDGYHLWVTGVSTEKNIEGAVFQVDPRTYETRGTVEVGANPRGVLFDGQHIWVANRGSKSLSCIDLTKEKSVATTWELKNSEELTADSPYYLAFDGEHIWVTDRDANAVWRLPADSCDRPTTDYTDTRITKINGMDFSQPLAIIFDGTYIWVANQGSNTIMRLNPDDCDVDKCTWVRIIKVSDINSQPSNLAYDGTFVWATLKGTGEVARIHARTGLVFGKPVIGQPIRISDQPTIGNPFNETKPCSNVTEKLDGIAFDGKYIWIASDTGWVCQLQANDITPVSEFLAPVEAFPAGSQEAAARITFDGNFVWIIITDGKASSFTRR